MYGSLFREWKTAATFVGGIAIVVAIFFSEGGGYESLELKRKSAEAPVAVAPSPRPAKRAPPPIVGGFTPDAELEAEFAAPTPTESPAASETQPEAAPSGEAAVTPVTPAAIPPGPSPQAGQSL